MIEFNKRLTIVISAKKTRKEILRIALFLLVVFCSCTNKKVAAPVKITQSEVISTACDTIHVSYSCSIKPILQTNCYNCHSTSVTSSGGLDLENFQSLKSYLNNYYRNDSIYGSKFYHIILQTPGTLSMPPASKLSNGDLSLIKKWIAAGGLQN